MPRTLRDLAALVGGEILGNPSLEISGVNGLSEAGASDLSFFGHTKYRREYEQTRAAAVLVPVDAAPRNGLTLVKVSHPHLAFAKISSVFHPKPLHAPEIHPSAHIHPQAQVHPDATVMANAVVERGATVGARTVLHPGAYVGADCRVGEDCLFYPNVVVREGCVVGSRVILHAGCVIGADGFGFVSDPSVPEHTKVPQAGIVHIEDDVEIGANSCVDRATLGETRIGRGTKIDNLVQIAHNVTIGPMSLICAQTGISGSTEIGAGVVLAGQVGVVGHIKIGNMVRIGAQTGVAQDVEDGQIVSGTPAMDHKKWLRSAAAFADLPDLLKELRRLTRRVESLEQEKQK